MMFLPLIQNASRLLSSKHPKLFSAYLVKQNGAMRKSCFSARQNAENEHPLKLKDQVLNWRFLKRRLPECDSLYFSLGGKPLKVKTLS